MAAKGGGDGGKGRQAERLAAALRENLKRRKAQARGRAAEARDDEPAAAEDGAQGDRRKEPPAKP